MLPFKWYREIDRAKSSQYFNTVLLVLEPKQCKRDQCVCSEHKGRYSEECEQFCGIVFVLLLWKSMVPKTAWLQTFFRISSFVFRSNTFIQVWNDLRASKWQNFHFWVNYPFKVLFWTPLTFHSMYGQKQLKHSSKHFIKICVYVLMHFLLNIHLEVINFH